MPAIEIRAASGVDHPGSPVVPRPSATVVLLRDGGGGPEVLLVKRHEQATFGASYVFPGGLLESDDRLARNRCNGVSDAIASQRLGITDGGLDFYSAAVRELYEETGILLASRETVSTGHDLPFADADGSGRRRLNEGTLRWHHFLEKSGFSPDCGTLVYFSYWVTPRIYPKRYAARFFMAPLPPGQEACHDGGEITHCCWRRPADALAAADAGHLDLPPPTRATLRELREFGSVAEALDFGREREEQGVACVLPAMLGPRDDPRLVLPDSADYPADHRGQQS